MVTRAEYARRLARAWRWWWAAVFFFGGGAASVAVLAITHREQLPLVSQAGMGFVALWAIQRLIFVLRRRPG